MKLVRFASHVLLWLVILTAVASVALAVAIPRIAGGTPYTVLTGSMEPDLPPGTLVVVRSVDPEEVALGDVITFQLESGEPTVATHRVVAVGTRLDGEQVFTTQGDANGTPDRNPVRAVQVQGRLWYSVPYLGHLNSVLTGKQRQTALLLVAALLSGYAGFMFVTAVRDGVRRRRGAAAATGRQPVEVDRAASPPATTPRPDQPPIGLVAGAALATLAAFGVVRLVRSTLARTAHH
ncbi:signal peptidase I [Nocardioides sp. J54]|uniref:signal peptidase I n=1 Tax=Nocardioides sp. J54 TaxID=935866 RepID=UPI0004BC5D1C|nr:signal peptidase I [Nocardioides sp. J54]